jgi:hypothetical protein
MNVERENEKNTLALDDGDVETLQRTTKLYKKQGKTPVRRFSSPRLEFPRA